jgi:hypothetical protein
LEVNVVASNSNAQRQPVNITVRSTPIRGGSYPAGYQIINTSLEATVWVANNPAVAAGSGTPINPGTSIVWNTDGDLWLILGVDTTSVAAGSADIVLSYDVHSWQPNPVAIATAVLNSGVLIIDNPVTLLETTDLGVATNTYGAYDVSRYNSVILRFNLVTAIGTYPRSIKVVFTEEPVYSASSDLNQLYVIQWEISQAYTLGIQYSATIPIRGKYCFVWVSGAGNQDIDIALTASYRQSAYGSLGFGQSLVSGAGIANGRSFTLLETLVQIPPGGGAASSIATVPPWHGEVEMQWISNARGISRMQIYNNAGAATNLNVVVIQPTVPAVNNHAFDFLAAALSSGTRRFVMDGRPLRIDAYNEDAVNRDFQVRIVAIDK